MFPWISCAVLLAGQAKPTPPSTYQSRFQLEAPCPDASPVMIDRYGSGVGLASETARNKGWQARIMWIDATANIDRYSTPEKIHSLVQTIADAGFNTISFDIKPISGQVIYKSSIAPKLTEWRGQKLPLDFDPVPYMAEECHKAKLSIIVSMNAFSEGHRLFKVGPGYGQKLQQTVIYIPRPIIRIGTHEFNLSAATDQIAAGKISVLSNRAKAKGGFTILLGGFGNVVSNSEKPDWSKSGAGTLLYGEGEAAEFLKKEAVLGANVSFDTTPEYTPISDQVGGQIPLMMNPNDEQIQDHALRMVREVFQKYDVDGMIYDDRLRYSGLDGDFSELTRSLFEGKVGHKLHWPDDVFKYTLNENLSKGIQPGPYYDLWISWRAEQIQKFVTRVRQEVKTARPAGLFGAYVGSWYGDYPALGHNYASPDAAAGFWFAQPSYRRAGTAPLLDYLVVGSYYPTATIYDAMRKGTGMGYTVEASGALCNRLVRDETWTYAGIDCGMFQNNHRGLEDAIQAACAGTQGVMVFDLSHGTDALWPIFKQVFKTKKPAPHQIAGSAVALRKHRTMVDEFHQKERPIIILNGASGTGQ